MRLLFLSACLMVACDEPNEPVTGDTGDYTVDLGDDPDFSDPHGRIMVEVWLQYGDIQLSGAFTDGPRLRYHTESERIGNCRLMTYTPSTCTPTCDTEEACIDGTCVAWPARQDRGDLEWVWPDGEQTVSPDPTLGYWSSGSASTHGDVSITYESTTLTSPTIDPPEADGDWPQEISSRGSGDATLEWSNPQIGARIRLHMTDCTGSHGGLAEAELECEGPDSGALVIPGAFLDTMDAGDWSHGECGSHTFERYHASAPAGDDTIRLETIGDGGLFYRPDW